MEFSNTVMEDMVSGPAYDARWTAASPLSRRPDVWYCNFSAICVGHATVGVLFDIMPDIKKITYPSLCSIKYCKRTADI